MSRLPTPGSDSGTWGDVLNDFLLQAHTSSGALKNSSVSTSQLQDSAVTTEKIADNAITAQKVATDIATQAELDNVAQTLTANTQTASYVLALSDAGKVIEMNSSSSTSVTIPLNSSIAFPIGTVIEVLRLGSGAVSIAATGGVTILSRASLTSIANRYGSVSLRKRATNEWVLVGDLT